MGFVISWTLHSEKSSKENIALKTVQLHMFSRKKETSYIIFAKNPQTWSSSMILASPVVLQYCTVSYQLLVSDFVSESVNKLCSHTNTAQLQCRQLCYFCCCVIVAWHMGMFTGCLFHVISYHCNQESAFEIILPFCKNTQYLNVGQICLIAYQT